MIGMGVLVGEVAEDDMEEQKMSRLWCFRPFLIAWIGLMTMPVGQIGRAHV